MEALLNHHTEAIKDFLREGFHENIFPLVTNGRVRPSAWDLFRQVNAVLPEIIKFLIEKSPAYVLDLCDKLGCTPLDYACICNCPEVVKFLLSQGSSVLENDRRDSPLLKAVWNVARYATPIASLLLDAGANINRADGNEETALMTAIRKSVSGMQWTASSTANKNYSCTDLCMLLIDRGCDVNATNGKGQTALHIAVIKKEEYLVRKLLISGCDIDRHDVDGFTPLCYACKNGNQRLVDLLIISGANLRAHDWETTFENWRSSQELNEKNSHFLKYVIYKSKQCLNLEILCCIAVRKNIKNVAKDAIQLGLPPLLVKRL
ncbi:putative ankyrin repeat protein, partial [Stegodyphus mimosarum]